MKIRIEERPELPEDELILLCRRATGEIRSAAAELSGIIGDAATLEAYRHCSRTDGGDAVCYPRVADILFFQTEDGAVFAHTKEDMLLVKQRLYELLDMLPGNFIRISKSAIVNTKQVSSVVRSISSGITAGQVSFRESYKQTYVSRRYYKALNDKLKQRS